jgi:cytochrome c oxidase assembly protein subunit 15
MASKGVRIWLLTGVVLISCMVFIGGVTRLTDSGLSITDWNIVLGAIPPMNDVEWHDRFEQYQNFPEYKLVNQDMTLSEFKSIFFWEYFHRLWGRMLGIVFMVPFVYFIAKKKLKGMLLKRSVVILFGGAIVGGIGWFMVLSGLVDRPDVSHYRLALHLVAALSLICFVYFTYLDSRPKSMSFSARSGYSLSIARVLFAVFFIQVIWGAFTAGLDAGAIYNTYPLMNGSLIPENAFPFDSFLKNITDHKDGVQLIHRYLGTILFITTSVMGVQAYRKYGFWNQFTPVAFFVFVQFILGVITILISSGGVPVWIGSIHQMGAILVLLSLVYFIQSKRLENAY